MKYYVYPLVLMAMALVACGPAIKSSVINHSVEMLPYDADIHVYYPSDKIPSYSRFIGDIKISDSGFSVDCGYEKVMEEARFEARKMNGNVLKLTQIKPPSPLGSSCYRIQAEVYRCDDFGITEMNSADSSEIEVDADYALIRIYRNSSLGGVLNYDLYLDNNKISRVQNHFTDEIKVYLEGQHTLWAKTEVKDELPIMLEKGKVYYIKCEVRYGVMIGRPEIMLVDANIGETEYKSISNK